MWRPGLQPAVKWAWKRIFATVQGRTSGSQMKRVLALRPVVQPLGFVQGLKPGSGLNLAFESGFQHVSAQALGLSFVFGQRLRGLSGPGQGFLLGLEMTSGVEGCELWQALEGKQ